MSADVAELAALLGPNGGAILGTVSATSWAEDAIDEAMARHPDRADVLWHCFALLVPTHELVAGTAMVYAAHCRELLERAAAGGDLRPATAVECVVALCGASKLAPLSATGTGLYLRLWSRAGLPDVAGGALEHYEAIRGDRMDEQEAWLRAKLARPERVLTVSHVRACPFTRASAGVLLGA